MGVKPGSVFQAKKAIPKAIKDAGFSTIDSFALHPDGSVYVTKGDEYISIKNDVITTKDKKKAKFPKVITDAGFKKVQGMAITTDGTFYVAADGQWMSVKNDAVKDKKQAFPKALTDAGFKAIDGFHMQDDGSTIVAQDGYYMTIKGGAVVTKKSPFPSSLKDALCGKTVYCEGPLKSGKPTKLSVTTTVAGSSGGSTATGGKVSDANFPRSLSALALLMMAGATML